MSSLHDALEKISILEVLIVLLAFLGINLLLDILGYHIGESWAYVGLIFYFIYRLRFFGDEFKYDFNHIFSKISFKSLVTIVLVNVFFSYGMLYFSDFILQWVNAGDFHVPFMSLNGGIIGILGFLSVVFLSPIAEELIFRGIFLNKLKIIVPTTFAVLISSLLFASLHSFGSIFSAFIFGICMAILYIKSENILVPIFGHFINNLIGESVYHLDCGEILFTNWLAVDIMSVFAVVSFVLLLKFICSNLKIFK